VSIMQTQMGTEPEKARRSRISCPVAVLCVAFICVLAGNFIRYPLWNTWSEDYAIQTVKEAYSRDGKVDINSADAVALCSLPGIGEAKAAAIIAWRNEHGGFSHIEELLLVKGIGEKTLQKLLPHISLS